MRLCPSTKNERQNIDRSGGGGSGVRGVRGKQRWCTGIGVVRGGEYRRMVVGSEERGRE